MKVVMVSHDFPLVSGVVDGGVQSAGFYLCSALRAIEGIDLEVVRPFAPRSFDTPSFVSGIKVHPITLPRWSSGFLHKQWLVQSSVRHLVRKLNPDVIHVQSHTVVAAMLPPEKTVLTIHGILERDVLYRGSYRKVRSAVLGASERLARLRLRNVIASSPYARQFIPPEGKLRIWDIDNAIADCYFEIDRAPQTGRVFSASTITERKNVAGLINAFAAIAQDMPEARLRLAGSLADTSYVNHCRRLAEDFGVSDRVTFLGTINIEQMLEELRAAACFALCSYQETAPLSIGEAMAAGVPVLASNICGIPYMVDHEVTGRLINPENPADTADGLRRMLFHDSLPAMGQSAKKKALQNYRGSAVAERTVAVYREILAA